MTTTVHVKSTCVHCGTINEITAAFVTDGVQVACSHCSEPIADWGVLRGVDRFAARPVVNSSRPSTASRPTSKTSSLVA